MSDLKNVLKSSFKSLDLNHSGVLEDNEALAFIESCTLHGTAQFNRLLRKQFDLKQKSLKITMDDVDALLDASAREEQESVEEIRTLFTQFDKNKSMKLESDEVKVLTFVKEEILFNFVEYLNTVLEILQTDCRFDRESSSKASCKKV